MTGFPKPSRGTAKAARRERTRQARKQERDAKAEVRRRDKTCRFPLCGCRRGGYALHVAHGTHKGMGGNPKGDRSTAAGMVLLCAPRHRESVLSIDRGTLRWEALTEAGADGPIRWQTKREVPFEVESAAGFIGSYWWTIAVEDRRGHVELTSLQRQFLKQAAAQLPR